MRKLMTFFCYSYCVCRSTFKRIFKDLLNWPKWKRPQTKCLKKRNPISLHKIIINAAQWILSNKTKDRSIFLRIIVFMFWSELMIYHLHFIVRCIWWNKFKFMWWCFCVIVEIIIRFSMVMWMINCQWWWQI